MAQAVITLTDDGDEISISLSFGEAGIDESSYAHHTAARCMQFLQQHIGGQLSAEIETEN